jgi:hypothetical protein
MRRVNPLAGAKTRIELDLRKELDKTFFGAHDEVAKGALNILRRMRRREELQMPDGLWKMPTLSSELEICPCIKEPHFLEATKEYSCEMCDGEGYLFDDEIVISYKMNAYEYVAIEKYKPWGKSTIEKSFFYVQYHGNISRFDKIIEPKHDDSGAILSPIEILHKHNIHMAEEYRSDYSRTEFWRLSCYTD